MAKTAREITDSQDFKRLVAKRRLVTSILVAGVFVVYFGFMLLVAFNKPFLATRIGEYATLGIPLAMLVIVLLWVLTMVYVLWANNVYDKEIERLKGQM
ncbi:MAG: DUF485 domain-containing protein [Pseudomonadota bacterium]